jgi:hypothetical protein
MSEPNYNETVVIPLLQKKYQELTNQNLVLEANLLVEKERNAHLQKRLDSLKPKRKKEETVDGDSF